LSGSTSQTPAQTTATSTPWSGAQGPLQDLYGRAQDVTTHDVGYQPYTGQTQAALDPNLATGLLYQTSIAQLNPLGTPGVTGANALAGTMQANQGITPGIQGAIGGMGQVAGQYSDIYNRALGEQNPYLQDILNTQGRQIQDRVASQMSGAGRYGSGMYSDVLTRALAESANPILAQDYQARQAQQMAATQGLGHAQAAIADIYGQGLGRAGQWAQLAPTLQAAQYVPGQQLQAAGQYQTDRAQQQLNDQIAMYNAEQARPWEQLSRYANILSGAGGLGGTKVTSSTPYQPGMWQRVLGGGLAGAGLGSAFGPAGAGIGALGGGALGGFL
jgi:hypothetical protein